MKVTDRPTASGRQVLAMAVITGTTIANIYYSQPILPQIAASLGVQTSQVGVLPLFCQIGFGLGLFFVAPLGDIVDAKHLVLLLLAGLAVSLGGFAFAPNLAMLTVASFLVGACATAVQVVVPMAASTAPTGRRAQVVSVVFTGTLVGILAARIVSGVLGQWFCWRVVFGLSSSLAAVTCAVAAIMLPNVRGRHMTTYVRLLGSTLHQFVRFPALRWLSLIGGLTFGTFCSFWITLTFHLSGVPFHFKSDKIGLFGFAALGGAIIAPWFGRLADRIEPARVQVLTLCVLVSGALCAAIWPDSVGMLALSTLLLDVGVQGTQVNGLAQIYRLDESAHGRINTVYIGFFFLGGAAGTACGMKAWEWGGWTFVCCQLVLSSGFALTSAFANVRLASRR